MRRAVVTGASRGLGAALAARLRAQGWDVLGVSRSSGVDLASPDAVAAWLADGAVAAHVADADEVLLVNNAGTVAPIGVSGGLGADAVQAAVQLNLTTPVLLTEAVLAARARGADVRVVHVSSGAGRRPITGWAVYCATKAALDMHAQAVAAEGLPGVRIAAVAPGVVDTDMQAHIRGADFPTRDRFVDLATSGGLTSPDAAAAAILRLVARPDFGERPVADVRDEH